MTEHPPTERYRGILIVPYDLPGGWVSWTDEARDACDVAASVEIARRQIDEHLSELAAEGCA